MRAIPLAEVKQRFLAVLEAVQREAIVIRRGNRDVAVIVSIEEYEKLRSSDASEFAEFCDRIARRAAVRGLTQAKLKRLLRNHR